MPEPAIAGIGESQFARRSALPFAQLQVTGMFSPGGAGLTHATKVAAEHIRAACPKRC